jgi:hypothetical protein
MKNALIGHLMMMLWLLPVQLLAQINVEKALSEYAWEKRQIILFSPENLNEDYKQFNRSLLNNKNAIDDRNLQVWRVLPELQVTLDDESKSHLTPEMFYDYFNVGANEFYIILLGYDGAIKLKRSSVTLPEIFKLIDSMPIRQQEMGNTYN